MYKIITVTVVACICSAFAFPQNPPAGGSPDAAATLQQSLFSDDGLGNWNYLFETSNGIKQNADGTLKDITIPASEGNPGGPSKGAVQKGSFSYTSPDGTPIKVDWIADENGFQPTGSHLPPAAGIQGSAGAAPPPAPAGK